MTDNSRIMTPAMHASSVQNNPWATALAAMGLIHVPSAYPTQGGMSPNNQIGGAFRTTGGSSSKNRKPR